MEKAKLIGKLHRWLPPAVHSVVDALARRAEARGLSLYLVGGSLRDLILGEPPLDVDLTLEGDAPALGREVAPPLGLRCLVHPAFLTATLKGDGFALDLATARAETYERPGALPRVRPASIADDLRRRDFSINAAALALTGPARGEVLDPCGGLSDLEAGLVRVLHERSFLEDATRILRAARYEARLGFRMEERTEGWLRRDVGYLASISGARLRQELSRVLKEKETERILRRLDGLGVLAAIQPALAFLEGQAEACARLRGLAPAALPQACWPLLAWGLDEGEAAALAGRLALTKPQSQAVCSLPRLRRLERPDRIGTGLKPSDVVAMLSPYPPSALWALAAATQRELVRERAVSYLRRWRYVKPSLDGHALLALGVPAGPPVGEVLRRLGIARLDGEVRSRKEEERLVRSLLPSFSSAEGQPSGWPRPSAPPGNTRKGRKGA